MGVLSGGTGDCPAAALLLSLTETGNLCIERTYYAMTCEIDAARRQVIFHTTEEVG